MTSLLRRIVAGPRAPHPEANLDLCYVTDNIIATSGPSATYPSRAYRNPLDALVKFLDTKHGDNWAIWEFRAEGTGYPDEAVKGRVWHFPWPDHHPPPFGIVPEIMETMDGWIAGSSSEGEKKPERRRSLLRRRSGAEEKEKEGRSERVIVVHCKAGKGRSGSMAVSYLIANCAWSRVEALQRFSERRMRPGFGAGVSIPSQLRWIGYVERWTQHGKQYKDRKVEVKEVHVWGLREGVKIAVEGFVERGKRIKTFHVFDKHERDDIGEGVTVEESNNGTGEASNDIRKGRNHVEEKEQQGTKSKDTSPALLNVVTEVMKNQRRSLSVRRSGSKRNSQNPSPSPSKRSAPADTSSSTNSPVNNTFTSNAPTPTSSKPPKDPQTIETTNTILRPTDRLVLPTSDINLALERRAHASYGWAMVTSIAHVWFNIFFEGSGPERVAEGKSPDADGVFETSWENMDGIKGSSRKGARALEKVAVVWNVVDDDGETKPTTDTPLEDDAESFTSAPSSPTKSSKKTEPPAWTGDRVRSPPSHGEPSSFARRLGPRPADAKKDEATPSEKGLNHQREKETGEEMPELDESSDEDGTEGIRRGIV